MDALLTCLIWNLAATAVMAAAFCLLGRTRWLRERPSLRHCLWMLVFLKLITPPFVVLPILPTTAVWTFADVSPSGSGAVDIKPAGSTTVAADPVVTSSVRPDAVHQQPSVNWPELITVVSVGFSLLVSLAMLWKAVRRLGRLRRLTVSMTAGDVRVTGVLQTVADDFGLRQVPSLVVVDAECTPMLLAGWRGATILLPRRFVESAENESLRHVFSHELAHLVRRDHLSNLVAFGVTCLFWWNPVVWVARRALHNAAEICCDALALSRLQGSRQSYARTLLTAAESATKTRVFSPALATRFGEFHTLKERIEMIANPQVHSRLSRASRLAVAGFGIAALMLLPVQAEQEEGTPPPKNPPPVEKIDGPGTASNVQPKIPNARLVAHAGDNDSVRAYFFKTRVSANSFAKLISTFKIADRIELVISRNERPVLDIDKKRMVMRPAHARQLLIDGENSVLFWGNKKQHAQVEKVMRALGVEKQSK